MINEFRTIFREIATQFVETIPERFKLEKNTENDKLTIKPVSGNGFTIYLTCENYGLYPSTEEWHAPPWDAGVLENTLFIEQVNEFILSMLQDAILEVHYSNTKPYKWILHYTSEGKCIYDETGLFFYNWFGKKHIKTFSNVQIAT